MQTTSTNLVLAPIRTAVVGFGVSGRVFHCPLIEADPNFSLEVIVTGDPGRASQATSLYPGARTLGTADEMLSLAGELDLVILGTPPGTHFDLASAAMSEGLHVVVDKPFVRTASEGETLLSRAAEAGLVLTVFQNRRWDADFLTLRKLLAKRALGEVRSFESRFEWWRPGGFGNWRDSTPASDAGGILHDLGAHLIDQAVQLFGPVRDIYGETARHRPSASADEEAFVSLQHSSGVRSRLWMNGSAPQFGPRFHLVGSEAGYTKWGLDRQEAMLASGMKPTDPSYGAEPENTWGLLGVDGTTQPVPAELGNYPEFYRQLAHAIQGHGRRPVDPADAVAVLQIIEQIHANA